VKIELERTGLNRIRAYAPGRVTVNDTVYSASLLVTPERVHADWPPASFAELAAAHFEVIAALRPEVVLLGTGKALRFPPPAVTRALADAGIGLEVMDTGAACRTYNILMGDERRVLAALLMIED
jgi:uncharacterized protein